MMSPDDRRKVFWLLTKYSSYTAWDALAAAYTDFADAFERAIREADEGLVGSQITGWYKEILDGQIAFEKGLARLRSGDKSVFRNVSTGYLNRAADALVFVQRIMDPDEFVFDWMPNQNDVLARYHELQEAIKGPLIVCEPDGLPLTTYGHPLLFSRVGTQPYPQAFEEIPSAHGDKVPTDATIPKTGIWQLVDSPDGMNGEMHYLLRGSSAPWFQMNLETRAVAVTWQLVWEDHRYEDGTIPPEEAAYLTTPLPTSAPKQIPERLRGQPGEVVPRSGWWFTPALKGTDGFRPFEAGDHFPGTQTTEWGSVIWYWDEEKQPKN